MKTVAWLPPFCALILLLPSCNLFKPNNTASSGSSYGPFDSNGTYREEWADDPSKWRKPGSSHSQPVPNDDVLPVVAKNDEPPPNSNPLAPTVTTIPKSSPVTKSSSTPKTSSSSRTSKTHSADKETAGSKSKSKSKETEVAHRPKSSSSTSSGKSKSSTSKSSTSKSSASKSNSLKSTTKVKPKTTRYTVKKGDSLTSIAEKNGSTAAGIKKASGLSSTVIRPGQTLVIPKD